MSITQLKMLRFFAQREAARLPPPTRREMCAEMAWTSTGTAQGMLEILERDGYLESFGEGKARSRRLSKRGQQVVTRFEMAALGNPS